MAPRQHPALLLHWSSPSINPQPGPILGRARQTVRPSTLHHMPFKDGHRQRTQESCCLGKDLRKDGKSGIGKAPQSHRIFHSRLSPNGTRRREGSLPREQRPLGRQTKREPTLVTDRSSSLSGHIIFGSLVDRRYLGVVS